MRFDIFTTNKQETGKQAGEQAEKCWVGVKITKN